MSYSKKDRLLICSKYLVEDLNYRQILDNFQSFDSDKYKTLGLGTISNILNRVRNKWDELTKVENIQSLTSLLDDLKKTDH